MKNILSITFALLIMLSLFNPASAANFPDVDIYEEEIDYLTELGILTGYSDGTFGPDNNLKRIQAVQMILREMGYENEILDAPNPGFTDLAPGDYGYPEVAKAVQLGFIGGKTAADGSKFFDLNGTLTRGQMAKILTEAYNLTAYDGYNFSDVKVDHWARSYVGRLATANITTGYEDGTFKPESKLKRKHFALFMARQLNDAFKPGELYVTFLDVGHGESILIEYPNGKTALVGAGRYPDRIEIALRNHGITRIDTYIASRTDQEYIGGAAHVIENYGVKKVIDSGQIRTTQSFIDYVEAIERTGADYVVASIGDNMSEDASVTAEVLYTDSSSSDLNHSSIGFMLSHREIDYLMTGSSQKEIEKLLTEEDSLNVEVLNISYSESETSIPKTFIDKVNPIAAVLSYGEDSAAAPNSENINLLVDTGAEVYTTKMGSVMFSDNGYELVAHEYEIKPPPLPPSIYAPYYTIRIIAKDIIAETVTIKNAYPGGNVQMGGWKLVSLTGEETFTFPNDFVLRAGQEVTITSGPNAVDEPSRYLKWSSRNLWNDYGDEAALYDSGGNFMQRFP